MKRKYIYLCPVCREYEFVDGPNSYEICPICDWEDDLSQVVYPNSTGANKQSLEEYRNNWEMTHGQKEK